MKWFALVAFLVAPLLCLPPACAPSGEEVILSPTPFGQLSAEEAESILFEYLKSQINTVTDNLQRYVLADNLVERKPRWEVHDREMGKTYLELTGMGYDGRQLNDSGLWRVHDVTGTVQPKNSHSQELLTLIQSE